MAYIDFGDSAMNVVLSDEQQIFAETALKGKNILVDACIGSGKTTAIQALCGMLPLEKNILYLTYNRLLKMDARSRIKAPNIMVTNYHGFAYNSLKKIGVSVAVSDLPSAFLQEKPPVDVYDVLLIDEYQDIDEKSANMLRMIKAVNPSMQIIAVGDMDQKIYDRTTLDVKAFVQDFLGEHEKLIFTKCFRLPKKLAASLGKAWGKEIVGVNDQCIVEEKSIDEIIDVLAKEETGDILCLGNRSGVMTKVLNRLEEEYPTKFNKRTVYASISDQERGSVEPKRTSAIFTTYDGSKGMERPICVVFDFDEVYWEMRSNSVFTKQEIIRNIFCVAVSRGKKHIILAKGHGKRITVDTMLKPVEHKKLSGLFCISNMFDFKYEEDLEHCFELLNCEKILREETSIIDVKNRDELIDLSPCIGVFQEAFYFSKYNIDEDIKLVLTEQPKFKKIYETNIKNKGMEEKVLFLTALETRQQRYMKQVNIPYIGENQKDIIEKRLATVLSKDEVVQPGCSISFGYHGGKEIKAVGLADVVKDDIVYELKFVSELMHIHFLQCACYMMALGMEKGILWNVRNNEMYAIRIPDEKAFREAVIHTVLQGYEDELTERVPEVFSRKTDVINAHRSERISSRDITNNAITNKASIGPAIAVIDVETNNNNEVMSIGVVIASAKDYLPVAQKYYVLYPEYKLGGMFSYALFPSAKIPYKKCKREEALTDIRLMLEEYQISGIYAYNASFDHGKMMELDDYWWYDIMAIAANRNTNKAIPASVECYKTGRMKSGYSAEQIYRLLSGDKHFEESHNALIDAMDELAIMRMLELPLLSYVRAAVKSEKTQKHDPMRQNETFVSKKSISLQVDDISEGNMNERRVEKATPTAQEESSEYRMTFKKKTIPDAKESEESSEYRMAFKKKIIIDEEEREKRIRQIEKYEEQRLEKLSRLFIVALMIIMLIILEYYVFKPYR